MSSLDHLIWALGSLSGAGLVGILVWSIICPAKRLWPLQSYSFAATIPVWTVTLVIFCSVVWLAIAGWAENYPAYGRMAGVILLIIGHAVLIWGLSPFGYAKTSGAADGFVSEGAYAFSRNPQYLGDMMILVGWVVLSGSGSAAIPALLGGVALLLAPFAEESWLVARYGKAYEHYARRVPRFVPRIPRL